MKRILVYSFFFAITLNAKAQTQTPKVLDKVVAVVGSKIVLESEVDQQTLEYTAENVTGPDVKCHVLEDLMYQKLLLLEGEKDSTLVVSDAQVEQELDKRMTHFIDQFGTKEKFESFYGKTVQQFKDELRGDVRDLILAQQMRGKVTEGITVSPEDVRKYFQSIPADSVPFINAQVEIAQIVRMPVITEEEKQIAKAKAEELRQRILKGENITTLAIMYSEDPASAKNQGEYKNVRRGEFLPEFEKVAFSLKEGETSDVFETTYGFHVIQLIHRHGDYVDIKHILIIPKVSPEDLTRSKHELDSIYSVIKKDTMTFAQAAATFSDDKNTKYNGGIIINPQTGLGRWDMEQLGQLDPTLSFTISSMKVGDVSQPEFYSTPDAKQAYRIILLKNTTKPHKANLQDDYQQIQNAALARKEIKTVNNWITRKVKEGVYIKIDPEFSSCHFQNSWIMVQ